MKVVLWGIPVLPVGKWEGGPGKRRRPVAMLLNQLPPGNNGEVVPNSHRRMIPPKGLSCDIIPVSHLSLSPGRALDLCCLGASQMMAEEVLRNVGCWALLHLTSGKGTAPRGRRLELVMRVKGGPLSFVAS